MHRCVHVLSMCMYWGCVCVQVCALGVYLYLVSVFMESRAPLWRFYSGSQERVPGPGEGRGLSSPRIIRAKGRGCGTWFLEQGMCSEPGRLHKRTDGLVSLCAFCPRPDCFSKWGLLSEGFEVAAAIGS